MLHHNASFYRGNKSGKQRNKQQYFHYLTWNITQECCMNRRLLSKNLGYKYTLTIQKQNQNKYKFIISNICIRPISIESIPTSFCTRQRKKRCKETASHAKHTIQIQNAIRNVSSTLLKTETKRPIRSVSSTLLKTQTKRHSYVPVSRGTNA